MIGIVLVAHAPLASAMLACAAHVLGSMPTDVIVIDANPDETPDILMQHVHDSINALTPLDGIVFLTDLFGATPSNAVVQAVSENPSVATLVCSGCNIPMLLRTLTYRHHSLQSLGEKIIMGGRNGIVSTGATPPQRQTFNPADHDGASRDYHQQ
jgi:PTS system ascorbate-specific IIA component